MKRVIAIGSCLIVLGSAALLAWVGCDRVQRDGILLPNESPPNCQESKTVPPSNGNRVLDPRVFELDTVIFFGGDADQYNPCYYDEANKTLYLWKGVVLRERQQIPREFLSFPSGLPIFDVKDCPDFPIVLVEPPVRYLESNGQYRPGYYFRSTHTFFEWKGIVLRKEELLGKDKIGKDPVQKPAFPSQGLPNVIEIDMPDYLKDQPSLWKKT